MTASTGTPAALDIVCMGEAMAEFSQTEPGVYRRGFGGDTSNCAIAAARQGASTAYLGALGCDEFGDAFVALWRAEGIDCSAVQRNPQSPTGLYFISHGPDGHRFSYRRAGSAAACMQPATLPRELLQGCRYLHLSAISQAISSDACDCCFEAMEIAAAAGAKLSYDTNLRLALWPLKRARAIIRASLARADIALPSLEDAQMLSGREEVHAAIDWMLEAGAGMVALTMGADGAWIATAEQREHIAPHPVQALDASGAGDTFDGALLARLAAGDELSSAARYASVAAALSTQGYGAVAPIPTAAQVVDALAQG